MFPIINVWDFDSILITVTVIYLVFYITRFYWRVYQLPSGPFPLPIIGNLLSLIGGDIMDEIKKIDEKYGPVFTVWNAWNPIIFITDPDIGKDAYRRSEFGGVGDTFMASLEGCDLKAGRFSLSGKSVGPEWEILRRVVNHVTQKYATSDDLLYLVSDCVDNTVKLMVEKEGLDKPFFYGHYLNHVVINVFSRMLFRQEFDINDTTIYDLKHMTYETNWRTYWWNTIPVLRHLDTNYGKLVEKVRNFFKLEKNQFTSHYLDYNPMITRDFTDALITAKNEEILKRKESENILTDDNIVMTIIDVSFSTTDDLYGFFVWSVYVMTSVPEIHQKLREEIESQIGDRIPTLEDKNRCHYTMAFISEVIRTDSTIGPQFCHITTLASKLDKFTISKGINVIVYLPRILRNEKYWLNSEQFRPERFLHNGKYVTNKPKAYIPFGVGRRKCIGDKMSINIMFLALVRFIQKTAEYELVLHSSGNSKPFAYDPNEVIISLKQKN